MTRALVLITSCLVIGLVLIWTIGVTNARSSNATSRSFRIPQCFQDNELNENLRTLKSQGGPDVAKVSEYLLGKAKAAPACRTQVVQALISSLEQATNPTPNTYENYFLWQHGATLLAELKATEALDRLIANIDLTDGLSTSLSHFPALVAILKIGEPAIPKLQYTLTNDLTPSRRKFAGFAIAYIGGSEAKKALTTAVSGETDPCVKQFLEVSLQAFDNKAKPNHVSSELNGKWLSAFYCL
jgi:hypothetical protein